MKCKYCNREFTKDLMDLTECLGFCNDTCYQKWTVREIEKLNKYVLVGETETEVKQ